jgi:hypothetical protein
LLRLESSDKWIPRQQEESNKKAIGTLEGMKEKG